MPTLADHLRALADDELAALIGVRPDLVVPVPADVSALAVRAQSRLSVARALDSLDRFHLEILDAVRYHVSLGTQPPSTDAVLALAAQSGAEPATVRPVLHRLGQIGLVYGPPAALHVVAAVDELSPYPAGLGRGAADLASAAAALAADPAGLRRAVLSAPQPARAVLDRLAAGPPLGTISVLLAADSPVRWLLEHHLLVRIADDTVELPREVALVLRRDAGPLGPLHPRPPAIDAPVRDGADQAGAGQSLEAVRNTEVLLEALADEPAPLLRSGGLGVRDLRRLARAAGVDEQVAGLLLEVAGAAGLVGDDEPGFLPTGAYDGWQVSSLAHRWRVLAAAWLAMPRSPALIGQRDDKDRPVAALAMDVERAGAPAARRTALDVLAGLPPGTAPTPEQVTEVMAWRTPRRGTRARAVPPSSVLAEAASLGLTGLGALTSYGRLLLAESAPPNPPNPPNSRDADPLGLVTDRGPDAVTALAKLLPAPVDAVVVQADLTVVVPGPPEPTLAAELALVADAESASVLRVTAESVRRALDAGYAASDMHSLFKRRSRTPVPQALTYLIDDIARRHGGLRAGSTGAYLRSEDSALIAEVQADRRLAALQLRRLASTVLVTPVSSGRLLDLLRAAGYVPVAEDATGAAVLTRPRTRRAPLRPVSSSSPGRREDPLSMPDLPPARLAGIVEQIRRGDAAARQARRAPVSVRTTGGNGAQAHTEAMAVLQRALRDKTQVWVGYVDSHGTPTSRLVRPVSMAAGFLRAEDERTETLHTFALYRITAAEIER